MAAAGHRIYLQVERGNEKEKGEDGKRNRRDIILFFNLSAGHRINNIYYPVAAALTITTKWSSIVTLFNLTYLTPV